MSRKKSPRPETIEAVVEWLKARSVGESSRTIANAMGWNRKRTSNVLCEAREQGLVVWLCPDGTCNEHGLWATEENRAESLQQIAEVSAQSAAQANRNRRMRALVYYHSKTSNPMADEVDEPMVHRLVEAATAPKLRVKAPNSIFALGAMA